MEEFNFREKSHQSKTKSLELEIAKRIRFAREYNDVWGLMEKTEDLLFLEKIEPIGKIEDIDNYKYTKNEKRVLSKLGILHEFEELHEIDCFY